jgi:pimeloyl-ACP methyl ester carboxylesterase
MKKITVIILLALLVILAGPVMVRQLQTPEQRSLEGETLDPARFAEIRFRNERQAIDLAGLLFLPAGPGPFPAAVIIHGSGASKRANRWYLTLTHYLQDNGIAVLLPDKRGSEQSGGDWRQASFEDLATDTLAAIRFLSVQRRTEISRIGVIGLSQGGWIAPLVADRSPYVSFLVSVVGSSVTTHQQFLYEEDHNLRQMGVLPGISRALAYPATLVHRTIPPRSCTGPGCSPISGAPWAISIRCRTGGASLFRHWRCTGRSIPTRPPPAVRHCCEDWTIPTSRSGFTPGPATRWRTLRSGAIACSGRTH